RIPDPRAGADRNRGGRGRAGDGPCEHDARRLPPPVAEAHAAAGSAAVRCHRCHHAGHLGDPGIDPAMVVLNRIYTRTGDDGTTALGSGERRKKYDLRVAAYGTLDELNAAIGLARVHNPDPALDGLLAHVQNDLFDAGADLCLAQKGPGGARMTVTDTQVAWLEQQIDRLNADLAPPRSFVLPAG